MAHFTKLDSNNIVIHISVVDNSVLIDEDGSESEQKGIEYLTNIHGYSKWKQTSYNGSFRKNYAGIGFIYNEKLDAFISPKPYESWVLDESVCAWNPPIQYPTDGEDYIWDESSNSWKKYSEFYS